MVPDLIFMHIENNGPLRNEFTVLTLTLNALEEAAEGIHGATQSVTKPQMLCAYRRPKVLALNTEPMKDVHCK